MNDILVDLQALTIEREGRRVVDALTLSVGRGEVYALVGGNGAGKTTTLGALLGFMRPAGGSARVAGFSPVDDEAAVKRRVAFLPENVALYPYLSGIENLQYFCALGGRDVDKRLAGQLLTEVGLQPDWHAQPTARYSKGMRQKVGLAIAHAREAQVMLLDEPTSGLDPAAANELAMRVLEAADRGMAVLMATHDLPNVRRVADRVGVLRQGRLVAEFNVAGLTADTLEQAYLAHGASGSEES
ncbi:MAG TPA: ABC transporter ATP-binding protein [Ramlibacter sp.]|nr:ABC transporter ATP-binding protein [Ramlibacter sp.]